MAKNPYQFTGPLNPEKDKIVCAPRIEEITRVINGINDGDYWSIQGPMQIGKTTFLNQLIKELFDFPCIYIDFEIVPHSKEALYEIIIDDIIKKVPVEFDPDYREKWKELGPEYGFYNSLKSLAGKNDKKIIFFFDEIGRLPDAESFLRLWRKIYNERYHQRELEKYAVIISGAKDLISLSYGPTSPFNISKKLILSNLESSEAESLIDGPMKELRIKFDPAAKNELLDRVSGHPQLLQHLCHLLVEGTAKKENKTISGSDLDNAIEELFKRSSNIRTLERQVKGVKGDERLQALLKRVLKGEKVNYLSYQDYSTAGVGPIIEDRQKCCTFRSPIYKEYLAKVLNPESYPPPQTQISEQEADFITTIYCDREHCKFDTEEEKNFLQLLFREKVEIVIEINGIPVNNIDLPPKEKLFFCYLAFKNYKAINNQGFANWKDIPPSYEYRVSSNTGHNEKQTPEWGIFKEALRKKAGVEHIGDGIRAWAHSTREKLGSINCNARDIIFSGSGRGSGYLLKGTVKFEKK